MTAFTVDTTAYKADNSTITADATILPAPAPTGTLAATEVVDAFAASGLVGRSGTLAAIEPAVDTFAATGPIGKTFLNPNRKSALIVLSNGNLTATRAA